MFGVTEDGSDAHPPAWETVIRRIDYGRPLSDVGLLLAFLNHGNTATTTSDAEGNSRLDPYEREAYIGRCGMFSSRKIMGFAFRL